MALVRVTHDLGVVLEIAQRVLVMCAEHLVETATAPKLIDAPRCTQEVPLLEDTSGGHSVACLRWREL